MPPSKQSKVDPNPKRKKKKLLEIFLREWTYSWNHVLVIATGRYDVHQRCFACVLQPDERQFHFLLEEQAKRKQQQKSNRSNRYESLLLVTRRERKHGVCGGIKEERKEKREIQKHIR